MDMHLRAVVSILTLLLAILSSAIPSHAQAAATEQFDPAATRQKLQSPDIKTRRDALWAISRHRQESAGLVDALVAMLKDPDEGTRFLAAYALTSVDVKRAAPALPVLSAMLRSDVELNGSSPQILGPIGLGRLGRAGANALVEALSDPDPKARIAAAQGLIHSDVFPPPAEPALIKASRGPDAVARHQALVALVMRKPPASRMIPVLLDALIDPEADMRALAATGLGNYEREAIRALEALKQTTKDTDGRVAVAAASSVAMIDRDAGVEFLPMFIGELSRPEKARLQDLDSDMRLMEVAIALGKLGPAAGRALPALRQAFEQDQGWAKPDLAFAIALVDPASAEAIVTYLISELDSDDGMQLRILARLPELGTNAAAAAPAVSRLTSSTDEVVRNAAKKALAAIRR
jgi:HEAT repeat protein